VDVSEKKRGRRRKKMEGDATDEPLHAQSPHTNTWQQKTSDDA
jgi:hypothetical protein